MPDRLQAIIFDFDYTLADSSPGIVECTNFALAQLGVNPVPAATIRKTIGLSLPDMYLSLTGRSDRTQDFTRYFISRADEVMAGMTAIMESVPETLAALMERDFRLGIVSTKFRRRIETILAREKLLDYFEVIIGGEDVTDFKPNPEGVNLAMAKLGSTPTNSIYVGDSLTDFETAKRAGIPFIALLTGPTTKGEFREEETYRIMDRISDLPMILSDSFG